MYHKKNGLTAETQNVFKNNQKYLFYYTYKQNESIKSLFNKLLIIIKPNLPRY